MRETVAAEAGDNSDARRSWRQRRDLHRFERAVLGAPAAPPSAVSRLVMSLRRRLAGSYRAAAPPSLRVLEAFLGQLDVHALRAMIDLGIPDLLERRHTTAELAEATGTDPERLARLLRFTAARGFLSLDRRGRVAANGVTRALRSDAEAPWDGWIRYGASPWFTGAWHDLAASLAAGAPAAFEAANGTDFYSYTTATDPAAGADFDRAMTAGATIQAVALARALNWSAVRSVCDVGGGAGAGLDVLQRYRPGLEATLFDLPEVTARATLASAGTGSGARRIVSGSFFEEIPADHDRYLLSSIIHNWDDDQAVAILANVRAAMGDDASAVVVESPLTDRPRDDIASATDLLMLALTSGGRERTVEQYQALFERAELRLDGRHQLLTGASAFVLSR